VAYRVDSAPEAGVQLIALEGYIAREGSPLVASSFVDAIVAQCHRLDMFPRRGSPRDDLRPGLRTTVFRRTVTIAWLVGETMVTIVGVFYRGRDWEALLRRTLRETGSR